MLLKLTVNAGLDIEIRADIDPRPPPARSESDDEGSDDGELYIEGVIMRRMDGWRVTCPQDTGEFFHTSKEQNVHTSEQQILIDRFHNGEYRVQRPLAPQERRLLLSSDTKRKRAAKRTPEECKAEWDALIASGIVRPMGPRDNPDVYTEESVQHLYCNPCGKDVAGNGNKFNACALARISMFPTAPRLQIFV